MPITIPKIIMTVNYPHVFWMWLQLIKMTCFQSGFKPLCSIRLSFIIRELKKLCIYTVIDNAYACMWVMSHHLVLLSIQKRLAAGSHLVLLGELIRLGRTEWGIFQWTLRGGSGTYSFCQIHLGQLLMIVNWNYLTWARASWLNEPIDFVECWFAVYVF